MDWASQPQPLPLTQQQIDQAYPDGPSGRVAALRIAALQRDVADLRARLHDAQDWAFFGGAAALVLAAVLLATVLVR